jgi:16S rRNA (guanine1516-N2)-methyltransferase
VDPVASTAFQHALVTVSAKARSAEVARAKSIAQACGLPFVPREEATGNRLLIVERAGVRLQLGEAMIRSHPGMGMVRLRRLVRGEEIDPLVELAQFRPGDTVLDATFGFGQDALVMAHAVQPGGRVVGVESSPLLTALALGGMSSWPAPAAEAAAHIELHCANYRDYLAKVAPRSFDVVYLDPMFRTPKPSAPDFAVLRTLANLAPFTAGDLELAVRAARRMVIVKDAWPGTDVRRLGMETIITRRSAEIAFGWVHIPA